MLLIRSPWDHPPTPGERGKGLPTARFRYTAGNNLPQIQSFIQKIQILDELFEKTKSYFAGPLIMNLESIVWSE